MFKDLAEILLKYDDALKDLACCQVGNNLNCYEDIKLTIRLMFGSGATKSGIEKVIETAIEYKSPGIFRAVRAGIKLESDFKPKNINRFCEGIATGSNL